MLSSRSLSFLGILLLVILAFSAAFSTLAEDPPGRTSSFYGTVTVAGQDVPAGTPIAGFVDGVELDSSLVFDSPEGSAYRLDLPADDPATTGLEGGVDGATVEFRIGGSTVQTTGIFAGSLYQRADLAAEAGADLELTKDDGVDGAAPGDMLVYTLVVTNLGDGAGGGPEAFGIVLEDPLPAGTLFVSASDGGIPNSGLVTWPVFDLAVGESATRTLTLEVATSFPAGTTEIRNVATVRSDGSDGVDPDPSNDAGIDANTLAGGPDLVVAKSADVPSVEPGGEVLYSISVDNEGFQDATGVMLADTLPAEVIFLTASDDGRAVDGVVTWPDFDLAVGETVTRTVRVRLRGDVGPALAEIVNTASASSAVADTDPADDTFVHTLPVVRETDLAVLEVDPSGATIDPQSLALSGTVAVTVENIGNADAVASFDTVIFEDLDGDDLYTPGTDNLLGSASASDLAVGEIASITVPVAGTVLFRDNRVHAFVDSGDVIPELDESNNTDRSGRGCEAIPVPGDFDPVVELDWPVPGTDVAYSADSLSTPIVVHLTDDNGDGVRGEGDVPDIVFVTIDLTFPPNPQPRLRAISGDTGARIFDVYPPVSQYLFFALTGMAAGDIDGDGAPEIVVSVFDVRGPTGKPNRLAAYSHTGQRQWISQAYATHPDGDSLTNRDNPTIADLDGDGEPEIVVGANVFARNGVLLWTGSGGQGYQSARNDDGFDSGAISIVADLDLAGDPEVVTGNTAYRSDGSIYWQIAMDDGYTAVANFDDDDFPEIVVVARGVVRLHQHDGTLIWATEHPGSGPEAGGAPTVADFDGDGEPEIGVAGSTQYAVFEGDGSVRWQTATQDGSSNMTGSTVFDLDGDGHYEVIYRDETALRIYRGDDGVVLYELPLSSITLNEQPVVADVDADGNAEIIVTSDVASGVSVPARTRGLRVIGDDDWVAARGVWNQHAYHIGNIGDDSSIPMAETPSWLEHNTYRANIAPAEGAFAAPDVTASRLVVDLLGYPTVRVTARIGNGGAGPVAVGLPVAFYDGDPGAGGQLVATATLSRRLAPGEFEDVTVTFPAAGLGLAEVYVAADDDGSGAGTRTECDEGNNLHGTTYDTDVLGLVLSADDGIEAVRPGDTTTYILQVTNAAIVARSGVAVEAVLPAGTTLVSVSDGGNESSGVVTWPLFALASEATAERTLTLEVDPAIPLAIDTLTLVATVSDDGSAGPDPTPENNTASDTNGVLTVIADAGGPYAGNEGEELVFDASASFDRDGVITSYLWDLDGDGDFDDATGVTAAWTFADDGTFTVAVLVGDDSGDSDTASATVNLANLPPSFELGADLSLVEGSAAIFTSVLFTDPGTADTHDATVDWGDGNSEPVTLLEADGQGTLDAAHAYLDDGDYTAELCLSDDDGATICDQVTVTITNSPPDVFGGEVPPVVIDEGELAEIALPFKDLGSMDTHTTTIDWGDGTVTAGFAEFVEGGGVVVFEETFESENDGVGRLNYSSFARWTVRDGTVDLIGNGFFDFLPSQGLFLDLDGSTGNAGILATRTPIAMTPGTYELRFALAGSRRGGTNTVIVRFGDLVEETITLTSGAPLEIYSFPFTVGGSLSATLEFEHLGGDNVGLLLDDILIADQCVLAERDGGFGDTGAGGDGDDTIVGSTCGLAGGSHVYPDDGLFDAELCVTDDDGGIDCATVPIVVNNVLPVVEAGDDRVALDTEPVAVDAVFDDPGILDPHEATIDWGDGLVETLPITPDGAGGGSFGGSHTYAAEGDYGVEVCVTDDDGIGCDNFTIFWRAPRLDLAVTLAADTVEVRPTQTVVLTATVTNEGSLDPGVVTATLALPPFHDFVAATGGGTLADGAVSWTIPSLGFQETLSFEVELLAQEALPFDTEVVASLGAAGDVAATDSDPGDDQASVTLLLWDDETPYVDPIDEEPLVGVEGDTVSLEAFFSTEPERLFLDDDFNGERNGVGALNYFDWENFSATQGSVDLIGNGYFDFFPGNGLFVDLDGSTGNAARFASREFFDLRPGNYTLAFDLSGNRRGGSDTLVVSVADVFSETIVKGSSEPLERYVRNFTIETATVGEVVFDHAGGDNRGMILDNVYFVRDCVATATVDWGDGTLETFDTGVGCSDDAALASDHVYLEDGVYPVEVCVTDAQEDTHCVETEAIIANAPPVVTAEDATVEARRPFTLDAGSFTDLGVLDLHTATIDWGDGQVLPVVVDEIPGSGTVVRAHGYGVPGTYQAMLCVLDDDGGEGCDPFTLTVTGASQSADLVAQKIDALGLDQDGDGIPGPGDFLTYDIVVSNLGGLPATDVRLTDVLEPWLALVPGGLVPGEGVVLSEDPITIELGTLEPGATKTVHFYVEILPGAAGRDFVSNQAVITSNERPALLTDDPDVIGVGDPTVTMIAPSPRLVVSKTDGFALDANGDGAAAPGDVIEYVLELASLGNVAASAIELVDPVPAGTEVVPGSVEVTVPEGSVATVLAEEPVTVTIDTLAAPTDTTDSVATVRFLVTVTDSLPGDATELVNQATVTSAELAPVLSDDPEVGGDADPTVTPVQAGEPELLAEKVDVLFGDADGDGLASPGDTLLYQLTVTNSGTAPASGVVLRDVLDPDLAIVPGSVQSSQGAVSTEEPVEVALGVIGIGETATVSFRATIADPFSADRLAVSNQAIVSSAELDDLASDDPDAPGVADPTLTEVFITPSIAIGDTTVVEGTGDPVSAGFVVTLSVPGNRETTVAYGTAEGSALAGFDYTSVAGTMSIPAGTVSLVIEVPVVPDPLDELDETFFVTLSDPVGATLSDGEAVGTILDDDEALISIDDVTVDEGAAGTTTEAELTVELTVASDREITVEYATSDGTATEGSDYQAASGTLTFAPGETSQTVTVTVLGDDLLESDEETFLVTLSEPTNAEITDEEGVGTILDDELCEGPNLLANPGAEERPEAGDLSGDPPRGWNEAAGDDWHRRFADPDPFEGLASFGAGVAELAELYQDVDVSAYAAAIDADDQAFLFDGALRTANEDPSDVARIVVEYRDALGIVLDAYDSGELASPLGWQELRDSRLAPVGTRTVRVRLLASRMFGEPGSEADAYFDALALRSLRTATITIDDVTTYEGDSGLTDAVFTVSLACAIDRDVTVSFASVDGTAVVIEDYLESFGTLSFPSGTTTATLTVPIAGDEVFEAPRETYTVDLSSLTVSGGVAQPSDVVLLDPQGLGTIRDDDFCPRSHGYWKNHTDLWPIDWMLLGGEEIDAVEMLALLEYNGPDASHHLALQLVAAVLDLESGGPPVADLGAPWGVVSIVDLVEASQDFLALFPPGSDPQGVDKALAEDLKNQLDAYVNLRCEDNGGGGGGGGNGGGGNGGGNGGGGNGNGNGNGGNGNGG